MNFISAALLAALPAGMTADNITVSPPAGENICLLSSLDLSTISCLNGERVRADKSTANNPITIRDTVYTSGVGTHAPSIAIVKLNGATRFVARLGIDDEAESADAKAGHGIVNYVIRKHVNGDKTGKIIAQGTVDRRDKESVKLDIDVTGWDYITLDAQQGSQAWADHVDWANAYFEYSGEKPVTVTSQQMYNDNSKTVNLPTTGKDGADIIPLSSLEISKALNGWGTIKANKSIDGNPITLNDTVYTSGVGAHATGQIIVKLNGAVTRFEARLGIDDEVKNNVAGHEGSYGICNYSVSLKAETAMFTSCRKARYATDRNQLHSLTWTATDGNISSLIFPKEPAETPATISTWPTPTSNIRNRTPRHRSSSRPRRSPPNWPVPLPSIRYREYASCKRSRRPVRMPPSQWADCPKD